MFDRVRQASGLTILLTLFATAACTLFVNGVLFQEPARGVLLRVGVSTGGWVQATLVAGLIFPVVVVVGCILGVGRLRPADVGWKRADLPAGMAATAGVWAGMQAVLWGLAVLRGVPPAFDPAWTETGPAILLGGFLAQILGNALAEETIYRGFLLPQFTLALCRRTGPRRALLLGLVLSQALFAVSHLPNRLLVKDVSGLDLLVDQAVLLGAGTALACVFLLTRNLWVAVGVHALVNDPVPALRAGRGDVSLALLICTVALVVLWRTLGKRWGRGGGSRIGEPAGAHAPIGRD